MRQTSIDTYHAIKESGLLSKLRFTAYDCIYHHGPITQSECFNMICHDPKGRINGHQSIAPRFAELKRFGVIEEAYVKPCNITGRKCIAWKVTGNLPAKPDRRITEKQKLLNQIKGLKIEIAQLKHQLSLTHNQLHFRFTL